MDDLISRQAAIEAMCELMRHWFGCDSKDEIREIKRELGKLPSAQPERKRGEWILSDDQNPEDTRNGNYKFVCSNCQYSDIHVKTTEVPFCWHCGADMRGDKDER